MTTESDIEVLLHRCADRIATMPAGPDLEAFSSMVVDVAVEADREISDPAWRDEAAIQLCEALQTYRVRPWWQRWADGVRVKMRAVVL